MRRVKTRRGWHEVVRVLTQTLRVSFSQPACRSETADGRSLALGYYLALWPVGASPSSYGCEVRYFGPFATLAEARLLEVSTLSLGIVETVATGPASTVENPSRGRPRPDRGAYLGIAPPRQFAQCYSE